MMPHHGGGGGPDENDMEIDQRSDKPSDRCEAAVSGSPNGLPPPPGKISLQAPPSGHHACIGSGGGAARSSIPLPPPVVAPPTTPRGGEAIPVPPPTPKTMQALPLTPMSISVAAAATAAAASSASPSTVHHKMSPEQSETRDAAALLTALSALAAKEVHIDGLSDLGSGGAPRTPSAPRGSLRIGGNGGGGYGDKVPSSCPSRVSFVGDHLRNGGGGRRASLPKIPNLGPSISIDIPISTPSTPRGPSSSYLTRKEEQGPSSSVLMSPRFAGLCSALEDSLPPVQGTQQLRTTTDWEDRQHIRARTVSVDSSSLASVPSNNNNGLSASAVQINHEVSPLLPLASDLSLPCEPTYNEEDFMPPAEVPATGAFVGMQQQQQQTSVLVSPPGSPAFKGLRSLSLLSSSASTVTTAAATTTASSGSGRRGGSASPSSPRSPRSRDRRKRYLDSHDGTTGKEIVVVPGVPPGPPLSSSPLVLSAEAGKGKKGTGGGSGVGIGGRSLNPGGGSGSVGVHTVILRKKFSWKNYPELEAFLVANREEYLRHSALNYTVQQKRYNNRLTERLLQLASECGYAFDESDFSFVTVRDRMRCYYKSYVQSSKKRGVVVGYAARRAGLIGRDELERSAGTAGRIVVPRRDC